MDATAIGVAEEKDEEQRIDQQDIFYRMVLFLATITPRLFNRGFQALAPVNLLLDATAFLTEGYKQNPRNTRRNVLPPEGIDGLLLVCHEHATRTPVELLKVGKTATGSNLVLQHTPEAFNRIEVVAAPGW
jgi:hypothetical protein